ncbi:contact-dependent growth inhibition system immunity protein [Streptomyces sp. NPDC004012]
MQRFTEFDFGISWVTGFFHQDWGHDGPTAATVVAKNLDDVDDEYVLAVRRDARTLHDSLPAETLELLWDAGADYMPRFEPITGAQWTQTVVDLCDARLSAKADVRPLAGADVVDGAAQLDAIVAEIGEAWFLEAKVGAALVDCARRCTPELAFRLLLRAILVAHDRSLTPEQYARLEAIGSALHYGEFVVASVQYLVRAE